MVVFHPPVHPNRFESLVEQAGGLLNRTLEFLDAIASRHFAWAIRQAVLLQEVSDCSVAVERRKIHQIDVADLTPNIGTMFDEDTDHLDFDVRGLIAIDGGKKGGAAMQCELAPGRWLRRRGQYMSLRSTSAP